MSPGQDLKSNPSWRHLELEPWPWIFAGTEPLTVVRLRDKRLKKLEIRTDERSNFLHSHSLSYSAVFCPHSNKMCCLTRSETPSISIVELWLVVSIIQLLLPPDILTFKDNIYWEKCIANTLTFQCIEVLHFHGLNFSENQNMRLLALFLVLKYCDARCVGACKYSV